MKTTTQLIFLFILSLSHLCSGQKLTEQEQQETVNEYTFSAEWCAICPEPTKDSYVKDKHIFNVDNFADNELAYYFGIRKVPITISTTRVVVCTATESQVCIRWEVWQGNTIIYQTKLDRYEKE